MGQPIKMVNRVIGTNKYHSCTECGNEDHIEKPVHGDFPYCGHCSKLIFDTDQNYCCWCGESLKVSTV